MKEIVEKFIRDMRNGLEGRASSMAMLRTYAKPPTGSETGSFLTVDWGGTNLRVYKVALLGGGSFREDRELMAEIKWSERHRSLEGTDLFDVVADLVASLVAKDAAKNGKQSYRLGFIFSFPAEQTSLGSAVLKCWNKGFKCPGVVGRDVALLLQGALVRRGAADVRVTAVANDTVGTQFTAAYQLRGGKVLTDSRGRAVDFKAPAFRGAEVSLGIIAGTGYNMSVLWGGEAVNTESGNFAGAAAEMGAADRDLDRETVDPPPGRQGLEKMISGKYLGEVLRREICGSTLFIGWVLHVPEADQAAYRDRGAPAPSFDVPYSLDGAFLSDILDGEDDAALESTLRAKWGVVGSSIEQREFLRRTARAVSDRSARLLASTVAAALAVVDEGLEKRHVVAMDGSVWEKTPGYQGAVHQAMEACLGREKALNVYYVQTAGGTAIGGAIIAAGNVNH